MRSFVLGTDWWTDCDDAVAMRILARAHKSGQINLLGIGINACMEYSVASLEGFLNSENIQNIEIAIDKTATDYGGNPPYQKRLSEYAKEYTSNDDVIDAVKLYRKILSVVDEKIEIIEIGYLQVLAALLESDADEYSSLSGVELVEQNVSKIWVMAGKWDEDGGLENNFCRNARSKIAAEKFCRLCPVPITFLGYEVGFGVISGVDLNADDLLYKVLCDHGSKNGRHSWDPMLVNLAIIGDEQKAGYNTVCGTASVCNKTGANFFKRSENGKHKYVIKKFSNDYYERQINELIC